LDIKQTNVLFTVQEGSSTWTNKEPAFGKISEEEELQGGLSLTGTVGLHADGSKFT
jgi:hypothetical protein